MKQLTTLLLLLSFTAGAIAQRTVTYNGQTEKVDSDEIRILSYNIKMLPRLIGRARYGTIKRARLIPDALIADGIDIIVFQEAFDVRARRILKRRLKDDYPFKIGPANRKFFRLKTNSGVLMYSKLPIRELATIDFSQCKGEDCLAFKGALLVEVDHPQQKFQLMGTHLEAGGPYSIKYSQYSEIREMINAERVDGIPQLLAGDFNTHKPYEGRATQDVKDERDALYGHMIDSLQAEDGDLLSAYFCTTNPFSAPERIPPKCEIIDFIFYRGNGVKATQTDRYVRRYQEKYHKKFGWRDLSDHNAVLMRLKW